MEAASTTSYDDLSVSDVFSPQADHSHLQSETNLLEQSNDFELRDADNLKETRGRAVGIRLQDSDRSTNQLMEITKRHKKRTKGRSKEEVAAALSTVRGFAPMASGDEDSDVSNRSSRVLSHPAAAYGHSPIVRPASASGVSVLKFQLDALSLSGSRTQRGLKSGQYTPTPSNASVCSDSDQTEVLTSYEVPLDDEFVSCEAVAQEQESHKSSLHGARNDLCRKMTVEDFEPLLCLGKGSFGTVLLVRHYITGKLYAQKQFRKASITVHKKLVEQTKTERMILESVNRHPFVVKFFYAFQDHEKLYLILEYAQGGELFTHLAAERMFEEDVAAFYMAEMVLALEHLHQNVGVIYRDLKPENCLLDHEGHLLLTDFGLSKIALNNDDRCNSSLGTIEYMAPEVIQGKPYGKACDWWSLGALGYDLLTGSPPFKANNNAKVQEKILKQKLMLPYFLGPDAKDLLTRLLRKEPSKRLGYHMPKDLQTIKKHRFFRKIDWRALEHRELEPPIKPVVTDPALAENFSVDFTNLPLSPIVTSNGFDNYLSPKLESRAMATEADGGLGGETDPFGGFSFVASSSLLNSGLGVWTAGI